jgi:hypothetical protein
MAPTSAGTSIPAGGTNFLAIPNQLQRDRRVRDDVLRQTIAGKPVERFALVGLGIDQIARPFPDFEKERQPGGSLMHDMDQVQIDRMDVYSEFFLGLPNGAGGYGLFVLQMSRRKVIQAIAKSGIPPQSEEYPDALPQDQVKVDDESRSGHDITLQPNE